MRLEPIVILFLTTAPGHSDWVPTVIDGPRVVVSKDLAVAEGLSEILPSNNNVGAMLHDGKLYMAWRSAPTHFASEK